MQHIVSVCKSYRMQKKMRTKICEYCNEKFTVPRKRQYNNTKYCCKICRELAQSKKHREAQQKYRKKLAELGLFETKYLGSSRISETRNKNLLKELNTVEKELRRLKLKKGKSL